MEALVRGKGLPCLQIHVGSVTKALQPLLDVLWWNAKFPQFNGTNFVVQNNALLLLSGLLTISRYMWCCLDVLLGFLHLAIAFERALFPGLPHRLLDRQLTFRGSEGSSNLVLCTIRTIEHG